MPRTATTAVSKSQEKRLAIQMSDHAEEQITLEALAGMLETVLENQQVMMEQHEEIVEKLVNLGLERDEYPGYRE